MRNPRSTPVRSALATLGGAMLVLALLRVPGGVPAFALLLASSLVLVDSLDFLVRWAAQPGRRFRGPSIEPLPPGVRRDPGLPARGAWAIVLSVRDLAGEVEDFRRRFERFSDRMWMIDDASTDDTRLRLVEAGFRCRSIPENLKKPGALRRLVATLPQEIETVLVMDPDCEILDRGAGTGPLALVLREFEESGTAAVCPRFVAHGEGVLARLQALEYELSCNLGRRSLGATAVTAGVSFYRRRDLEETLAGHSLSVYAEDFENAVSLLARGRSIYFDDRLVVRTLPKPDWRSLASQRIGWSFGHARVYAESWREILRASRSGGMARYQYLLHLGLFGLALHPIRVGAVILLTGSLVNGVDEILALGAVPNLAWLSPLLFPVAYLSYLILVAVASTVALDSRDRARLRGVLPLYPLYQLFLVVPTTIGLLNWCSVRLRGRRLVADHYDSDEGIEARSGRDGHRSGKRPRTEDRDRS